MFSLRIRWYNLSVIAMLTLRTYLAFSVCALLVLTGSCARDSLKGAPQAAESIKITARFDSLQDQLFYFFVFNFTNAASPSESKRPEPNVSGIDRGKNWELYIVYHHTGGNTGAVWEVLRRVPGDGNYWVDEIPEPLMQQFYYLNASATGNMLTIELDPLELVDPNNAVPSKFILDVMSADTGIDKQMNPEDRGLVYDWLDEILIVDIEVGRRVEERDLLIEEFDDSTNLIQGSDLIYWTVEVK